MRGLSSARVEELECLETMHKRQAFQSRSCLFPSAPAFKPSQCFPFPVSSCLSMPQPVVTRFPLLLPFHHNRHYLPSSLLLLPCYTILSTFPLALCLCLSAPLSASPFPVFLPLNSPVTHCPLPPATGHETRMTACPFSVCSCASHA